MPRTSLIVRLVEKLLYESASHPRPRPVGYPFVYRREIFLTPLAPSAGDGGSPSFGRAFGSDYVHGWASVPGHSIRASPCRAHPGISGSAAPGPAPPVHLTPHGRRECITDGSQVAAQGHGCGAPATPSFVPWSWSWVWYGEIRTRRCAREVDGGARERARRGERSWASARACAQRGRAKPCV